jgi:hypothetical protein
VYKYALRLFNQLIPSIQNALVHSYFPHLFPLPAIFNRILMYMVHRSPTRHDGLDLECRRQLRDDELFDFPGRISCRCVDQHKRLDLLEQVCMIYQLNIGRYRNISALNTVWIIHPCAPGGGGYGHVTSRRWVSSWRRHTSPKKMKTQLPNPVSTRAHPADRRPRYLILPR